MTRWEQTVLEIKAVYPKAEYGTEIKMVNAELCHDLTHQGFTQSWTEFKLPAGELSVKKFIDNSGFKRCKRYEASLLLIVGEKTEEGCFIIGKFKRYWLKSNPE